MAGHAEPLSPLLAAGMPVNWWFIFKFNGTTFPCAENLEPNPGIFGGTPMEYGGGFSLNYAWASSANASLQMGKGYLGTSLNDPLGATFSQIYHGACNYVLWNDEFYNDPMPTLDAPWGHSKGLLAWDQTGAGFVLQVSTPSWPASGSVSHPRKTDGNTLGCVRDDDCMVSQHFFALKLTMADVAAVLSGLANASVVTKPGNLQIFNVGGPAHLETLAQSLGTVSPSKTLLKQELSSGVTFISKPSQLHVPPWQMVSAELGSLPLRVVTWWDEPMIYSTLATTPIKCWETTLGQPGPVQVATTGTWQGKSIGLTGGEGKEFNHAKLGVSQLNARPICIFGDMNQQGTLDGDGQAADAACASAQNGRGGTFYALSNPTLFQSLTGLLAGQSAPVQQGPQLMKTQPRTPRTAATFRGLGALLLAGLLAIAGSLPVRGDEAVDPVVTGAASLTPEPANTLGLNDHLVVQVQNLSNLLAQAAGQHRQIIPYLDGFALPGLYPESVDSLKGELRFPLQRTDSTRQAWATLLGGPTHFVRPITVSVGLENDHPIATEVQGNRRVNLVVIHPWSSCVGIILLGVFLVWFGCHGKNGQLLRDAGPDPGPGKLRPYSLAKTQMAVWSIVILGSFLAIWAVTGAYDSVTTSALVLMGIGAGTALGVIVQDQSKAGKSTTGQLQKQRDDLASNPVAVAAVAALDQKIKALTPSSDGFLTDILTDANGLSLHRLQMAIWTMVLVVIFLKEVYCNLAMPEFSDTLLALMGISAGAYVGFMIPEGHSSDQ